MPRVQSPEGSRIGLGVTPGPTLGAWHLIGTRSHRVLGHTFPGVAHRDPLAWGPLLVWLHLRHWQIPGPLVPFISALPRPLLSHQQGAVVGLFAQA